MRLSPLSIVLFACSILLPSAVLAQSFQYVQNFDHEPAPALPAEWSAPTGAWTTSTGVASPGSGANNVQNNGNAPGTLVSPVFDLSQVTSGTLRYAARRTSTYDSLNLKVEASLDAGAHWTVVVVDSGASLPKVPSTYVTITAPMPPILFGQPSVRFRFLSRSTTGGNLRIDDVTLTVDTSLSWNRFGLPMGSTHTPEHTDSLVIPIGLHLISSSDTLQGLQFTVNLSAGLSLIDLRAHPGLMNASTWHVSYEHVGSLVKVVAIAEAGNGLGPMTTDSLFLLYLHTFPAEAGAARTDSIRIGGVIAAAGSPTGDGLAIAVDPNLHLVLTEERTGILSLNPSRVELGTIQHGSDAVGVFSLTNAGTERLDVVDIYSVSGKPDIIPTFLMLEPDSAETVTVTVHGANYEPGALVESIIIEHSGESSPDSVTVVGSIVAPDTLGDANDDGQVDIVDLVLGIDFILGRTELSGLSSRLDIHPYPGGNGSIDVRDLTVLAYGIANGIWPDGILLRALPITLEKRAAVVGDLVLREEAGGLQLHARVFNPIRAVHLVAQSRGEGAPIISHPAFPMAQVGIPYRLAGPNSFSILVFGMDDFIVPAGPTVPIAFLSGVTAEDLEVISAVAVDQSLERRTLQPIMESNTPPSDPDGESFGPPYPNPANRRKDAGMHLPITLSENELIEVDVSDVMGRSIRRWQYHARRGTDALTWDLRNDAGLLVSPGIFFVTMASPRKRATYRVIVL